MSNLSWKLSRSHYCNPWRILLLVSWVQLVYANRKLFHTCFINYSKKEKKKTSSKQGIYDLIFDRKMYPDEDCIEYGRSLRDHKVYLLYYEGAELLWIPRVKKGRPFIGTGPLQHIEKANVRLALLNQWGHGEHRACLI